MKSHKLFELLSLALIITAAYGGVAAGRLTQHLIGVNVMSKQESIRRIPLTQGQFALVDAEDYEELSKWKWCASKDWRGDYVAVRNSTGPKRGSILMHRQILGLQPGDKRECDHKNHNKLDNRQKVNLRICTNSQNKQNGLPRKGTSEYKGVSWCKANQKWRVQIKVNGQEIHLGYFDIEIEAARAYDHAAIWYFGEYACFNFPKEVI